jgi:hypothetical protein
MDKKKTIIFIIVLLIVSIFLFFLFSLLLKEDKNDYNYEHVISHSFIAEDGSFIVFNDDMTFYWYRDKDNLEDNYYYGVYEIYRGENAIGHISSDLSLYNVTEEEQRNLLKNKSINNYYNWNLYNKKLVSNHKEETINRDSHYYGLASNDYKSFELVNMNSSTYATFTLEK